MRPIHVHMVSLGCPKNLVDSEVILGRLGERGCTVTPYPELADVLMVNTCGFIDAAREESVDTILELAAHKEADPGKRLVVAGCLGQRYPEELLAEIPELDAVVGLGEYGRISEILADLVEEERRLAPVQVRPPSHPAYSEGSRLRLTAPHTTYLRISEGCDNPCTFCAIPSFRGRFRSKPVAMVVDEAKELIDSGAVELNLISQDLTSYGVDRDGQYLLPRLLEELDALDGVRWIRLLYTYPYKFSDAMIDAVADLPRVVPYVDMPLQHIADATLRRMGRRLGEAPTRGLIARMRERIPGLVLRSTFIVGFPGETDEEFATLEGFLEEARLERVGVFTYSPEEGTPAVRLPDPVEPAVAEERRDRLMQIQQAIAFAHNARRVGTEEELLIDGREQDCEASGAASPRRLVARSYAEAPDIDGRVYLPGQTAARAGSLIRARIADAEGYDLRAEALWTSPS